jgi:pimeloyl-ACP methyl ester carboxylesterase
MTQAQNADAVTKAFSEIPALPEAAPALVTRGRFLDCDCRLGPTEQRFCFSFRSAPPASWISPRSPRSCTPEDTKRTAASIAGARVTIMEELGHFPMSENPEQFRRHVAPVLAEITKAKTSPKQGVHA